MKVTYQLSEKQFRDMRIALITAQVALNEIMADHASDQHSILYTLAKSRQRNITEAMMNSDHPKVNFA